MNSGVRNVGTTYCGKKHCIFKPFMLVTHAMRGVFSSIPLSERKLTSSGDCCVDVHEDGKFLADSWRRLKWLLD
jgi:hypothetical protein